jgi:hypothetical protein
MRMHYRVALGQHAPVHLATDGERMVAVLDPRCESQRLTAHLAALLIHHGLDGDPDETVLLDGVVRALSEWMDAQPDPLPVPVGALAGADPLADTVVLPVVPHLLAAPARSQPAPRPSPAVVTLYVPYRTRRRRLAAALVVAVLVLVVLWVRPAGAAPAPVAGPVASPLGAAGAGLGNSAGDAPPCPAAGPAR